MTELKLDSGLTTTTQYREWIKARSSKFLRRELGALKANPKANRIKIEFITFVLNGRDD